MFTRRRHGAVMYMHINLD